MTDRLKPEQAIVFTGIRTVSTKASYAAPYLKGMLHIHDEEKVIEIAKLWWKICEIATQWKFPETFAQESKNIWNNFDDMTKIFSAALYALGKVSAEYPNTRTIEYAVNLEAFETNINEESLKNALARTELFMNFQTKLTKAIKKRQEMKKAETKRLEEKRTATGIPQTTYFGARNTPL